MVAKGQTPSIFLELNNTEECRIDAANVRLKGGHIPSLHDIINEKINAGASRDILNDLINKALNDKNKWECKSSVADALSMTVTNVSTCTQLPIVPFKPIHPRERR